MRKKIFLPILSLIAGLCIGASGYHVVSAQQAPPTKGKGQSSRTLVTHDVSPQMPEFQGYYLEMKLLTIEPGGNGRLHSHKDRPVVHYVLQGTFSSCDPDGKCTELQEGQAWAEGKDITHWPANRGTKPLKWLAVEIRKKP